MPAINKRINFQLDESLHNLFSEYCNKRGVSKAAVLREWVENYSVAIKLKQIPQGGGFSTFNFVCSSEIYDKITLSAEMLGIPKGAFLRLLIASKIGTERECNEATEQKYILWNQGRLADLISLLDTPKSIDSSEDCELLAMANIGLGKFTKAEEIIQKIEDTTTRFPIDNQSYARILSLKAEMARYRLDTLASRQYLETSVRIALTERDTCLLGKLYYQLGMLEYMADNPNGALRLFLNSIDNLDINRDLNMIAVIYLYLARLQEQDLNHGLSLQLFKHAEGLLKRNNNAYYLGWVYNALGMSEAIQGNSAKAENYIHRSLRFSNISGSEMEAHYSYKYLGVLSLSQGKFREAHTYFNLAEKKERIFRPKTLNSRNQLMKLIVESKSNYNNSIQRMEKLVSPHRGQVKPALGKYLLGSAKYLHGNNARERGQGANTLRKLSNIPSGAIKIAAQETLKTGRMQVIR